MFCLLQVRHALHALHSWTLRPRPCYLVWTCRDPIFSYSRDLMMILSDYRDPISNSTSNLILSYVKPYYMSWIDISLLKSIWGAGTTGFILKWTTWLNSWLSCKVDICGVSGSILSECPIYQSIETNLSDLCRQAIKVILLFPTASRCEAAFQHYN